jgi:hypothetical protein
MAITRQRDRRKTDRGQSHRRKSDIEIIKTEREGGIGQEVTVRHETAPQRKDVNMGLA